MLLNRKRLNKYAHIAIQIHSLSYANGKVLILGHVMPSDLLSQSGLEEFPSHTDCEFQSQSIEGIHVVDSGEEH